MIDTLSAVSLHMELAGIILCIIDIVTLRFVKILDKSFGKIFTAFFACILVSLAANGAAILADGRSGFFAWAVIAVGNFCEFTCSYGVIFVVNIIICFLINMVKDNKKLYYAPVIIFAAEIILLIISQFTNIYYYIDAGNVYHRSDTYILSQIMGILMVLNAARLVIKYRSEINKREFRVIVCVCVIMPFISISLQTFVGSLYVNLFAMIIAAAMAFGMLMTMQTNSYNEAKRENVEMRVAIMLSQIQPHFLYNALAVIQDLCRTDPPLAEQAVLKFSQYLRVNMDSLTEEKLIDFNKELEHTKTYLDIEQMRFEPKLSVRYDISCSNFKVPTLTLQPIAENAVRYGARENAEGKGVVTIATKEYSDRYEITVTDNGNGFNPDAPPSAPHKTHIGIKNVRDRLKRMCGGELVINSVIGKGTAAAIVIPKEGNAL